MNSAEHLLTCLMEECAEISEQAARLSIRVSKALRFGLHEVQDGQFYTNLERMSAELGDLLALGEMLIEKGLVSREDVESKKQRVTRFMDYAALCGALTVATFNTETVSAAKASV